MRSGTRRMTRRRWFASHVGALGWLMCWNVIRVCPKIGGKTPKWMIYMEIPIKMDDLGGTTIFRNTLMFNIEVLYTQKTKKGRIHDMGQ